jgi:hypothetical protein
VGVRRPCRGTRRALAAQRVQARATPSAYARWEITATALVAGTPTKSSATDAMTSPARGTQDDTPTCRGAAAPQDDGAASARTAGISLPDRTRTAVVTAITWGLAQRGTSYVCGGDCTDAHSLDPARHCDCSDLHDLTQSSSAQAQGEINQAEYGPASTDSTPGPRATGLVRCGAPDGCILGLDHQVRKRLHRGCVTAV